MKTKGLALSAVLLGAGLLGGCSASDSSSESKDEVIMIGTQNTYPPFAYADEDGELTGLDVEVAKEVDKRLDGYTFDFYTTTWDSIFLALESNKVQAIFDEVAKTPEREEKYLFTDESYFSAQSRIVVKNDVNDVESLADLEGKTVGSVAGDTYTMLLEEYNKTADTPIELKYTESGTPAEFLQELQGGRIDAYVNDPVMMNAVIEKNNLDLKIVGEPLVSDNIAVVLKDDEQGQELKALIDPILKEMKEDGTLDELSDKWTGGVYVPQ